MGKFTASGMFTEYDHALVPLSNISTEYTVPSRFESTFNQPASPDQSLVV